MKKAILAAAMAAAGICARGDNPPQIRNVTLAQQQDTRLAVVTYEALDAGIATFQFRTGGVDVAHSETVRTVTGQICRYVAAGTHQFVWNAGRDFPERIVSNLTVEVTLWATNYPPPYCAVNLVADGDGQFTVLWYGKETEMPFGVTDSRWKKDWLLLRQIPSTEGVWVTLGSPDGEGGRQDDEKSRNVHITQPFYMGVYGVTQRQWENIASSRPSYWNNTTDWEERPVEQVTYDDIRGSTPAINWPGTGHVVDAGSFMGKLRAKTGLILQFDLPTEAQWEYACRAGTSGPWNNGMGASGNAIDANLALLGRYKFNGGFVPEGWEPSQDCRALNATAKAGSYLSNAWGLYDMHGNLWEWCLDYYIASGDSLQGDDPVGPTAGDKRMQRGGCWSSDANACRSASRGKYYADVGGKDVGFRVAAAAWVSPVGE